jgi:hypothetical protein
MNTIAATSSDRSLCGKRARIPPSLDPESSSLIPGSVVALGERAVAARLGRALGRGESDGTAVAAARMPALTLAASVRTTRNEGKRRSLVRPKRLLRAFSRSISIASDSMPIRLRL